MDVMLLRNHGSEMKMVNFKPGGLSERRCFPVSDTGILGYSEIVIVAEDMPGPFHYASELLLLLL